MMIPILDLSKAQDPASRPQLLEELREALFNIGFLYITNHGVENNIILNLANRLPELFNLPSSSKAELTKLNSPHFLGYSGFAEETTLGKQDLREQFDYATELSAVDTDAPSENGRDFSKVYWRLRGPNQWPQENELPGFKQALLEYHDALSELSFQFIHLIEEAFGIPVGTFDKFFGRTSSGSSQQNAQFLAPQHRMKLVKYPGNIKSTDNQQGVGAHKDSSGLITFLYQVGNEPGLEVLDQSGTWIAAPPIPNTFVVNFGNAFEAATEGAVLATVHRVRAPTVRDRYSIPFFMGLPLDMTVSQIRKYIPSNVRALRRDRDGRKAADEAISSFLDQRWDSLGESQLRKWIRSHREVGVKWYGQSTVDYYTRD